MTIRRIAWDAVGGMRFVRPCTLPLEALAEIAATLSQRLRRLFEPAPTVDFFPPVALESQTWEALCENACLYPLEGARRACIVVLSVKDARALVGRACGEHRLTVETPVISRVERRVLDRFVEELVPTLEPLCGRSQLARTSRATVPAAFVQMRVGGEAGSFSFGLGFDEDPEPPTGPTLDAAALEGCPLDCSALLGTATVEIAEFAALSLGAVLRLDTKVGPSATLKLGPNPIASGEGGVLGARAAFLVHDVHPGTP
ncbi:MAG: FliM/FliN family flagellar motor switch protein [Candidatus Eremiobacteraeota bacterium]|nr:FliM/FliN family flagellar motor switch protein [Candidatus Eremiobacteraeota bacterium]